MANNYTLQMHRKKAKETPILMDLLKGKKRNFEVTS